MPCSERCAQEDVSFLPTTFPSWLLFVALPCTSLFVSLALLSIGMQLPLSQRPCSAAFDLDHTTGPKSMQRLLSDTPSAWATGLPMPPCTPTARLHTSN
eukprot:1145471-Pelagomonas_calceolata.AAC.9